MVVLSRKNAGCIDCLISGRKAKAKKVGIRGGISNFCCKGIRVNGDEGMSRYCVAIIRKNF
jgi:hypothetical protein